MNAPARTCGTCNLCCKVMYIEELEKPQGAWCPHAKPGQGCSIYGSHPSSCQTFMCQWLLQPALPESLKPSRSKVVLSTVAGAKGDQLVAYCDPSDPTAWRRGDMYKLLKAQTRSPSGHARMVVVRVNSHYWLVTPDADHDLGEADGRKAFRIEPGPDGKPVARLVNQAPVTPSAPRTPRIPPER